MPAMKAFNQVKKVLLFVVHHQILRHQRYLVT